LGVDPAGKISECATFALTWEGLKVTGNDGVVAKIGKDDTNIINITKTVDGKNKSIFRVGNDGTSEIAGWMVEPIGFNSPDGKIWIAPKGKKGTVTGTEIDKLLLKAGDSFGVTTEGVIYANAGYIGSMEIGDLVDRVIGQNLLLNTSTPCEWAIT
jgi:hypothetical protein